MSAKSPSSGVLDRIERFAGRPVAVVSIGAWAAAEAIALPIVPDVGLCLLALVAPRRATLLFAAVVVGALIGTLVLAAIATQAPDTARAMLLGLPGIDTAVLSEANHALARDGVAGFAQFGPGVPLKVHTIEWLGRGGDALGLLVGAILNRITRIGPVVLVAALIGATRGPWLGAHARLTLAAYAAFWIVLYAILWS